MREKAKQIIKDYKGKKIAVFIDDANMFYAQRKAGWKIDWNRFKKLLEKNFKMTLLNYYVGVYPRYIGFEEQHKKSIIFINKIEKAGFNVIQRPLKKIFDNIKKNKFHFKCDFDAEIGFDVGFNTRKFDVVLMVSGDSDFTYFRSKLSERGKKLIIVCFKERTPWEIHRMTHIFFEEIKEEVERIKKTPR